MPIRRGSQIISRVVATRYCEQGSGAVACRVGEPKVEAGGKGAGKHLVVYSALGPERFGGLLSNADPRQG